MQQMTKQVASGTFREPPPPASGAEHTARPEHMKLATLIHYARIETQHFFLNQPCDSRFMYEIFRRAVVERNEDAWTYLYASYSALVHGWVQRSGAFTHTGESSEVLVNMAFARFWQAVSSKNFAQFPTLPSLLAYLRRCAETTVIDNARSYNRTEMLPSKLAWNNMASKGLLEDETIDRMRGQELWAVIHRQLRSDAERVLVECSFRLGMPSRAIYQQHQDLFEDITSVYTIKRNLLERLSRNAEIRQLLG